MRRLLIALMAIALCSAAIAEATPRTTAAIAAYKKVQRDQRQLKRRVQALSTGEKIEVKTFIENSSSSNDPGADPDSDRLVNESEEALGTNSCSADTDGDGHNDGEDDYEDGEDGKRALRTAGLEVQADYVTEAPVFTLDAGRKAAQQIGRAHV